MSLFWCSIETLRSIFLESIASISLASKISSQCAYRETIFRLVHFQVSGSTYKLPILPYNKKALVYLLLFMSSFQPYHPRKMERGLFFMMSTKDKATTVAWRVQTRYTTLVLSSMQINGTYPLLGTSAYISVQTPCRLLHSKHQRSTSYIHCL